MKFFKLMLIPAKRAGVITLLSITALTGLAACGGDTPPPTQVAQPTQPVSNPVADTPVSPIQDKDANVINVQLKEWAIVPAGMGIPAGNTRIVATNIGEFAHNLVIKSGASEVQRTPNFTKDESPKEIVANLQAGQYTWLCDIPGHAEKGMTGTLTVGP